MEPSAWGLYWSNPGLGDSQNRVPQHRLQAEFGPVKSTGESACVYPPQPLESQTKLGSHSTKRSSPKIVARVNSISRHTNLDVRCKTSTSGNLQHISYLDYLNFQHLNGSSER